MKTRHLLALLLAVGLLLPQFVAAQEEQEEEAQAQPITWVSFVQAQPGKGDALSKLIAEAGAKIYDKLMADGHALSWGVAQPVNHWPDDNWSHAEWVTFKDWEGVNQFVQAFIGAQMAKSEEQRAAEQAEWLEHVVPGSHFDAVNRHLVVGEPGKVERPWYINLGFYKAKPGQSGEVKKVYEKYAAPVMKKLQADGAVGGYGLYTSEIHGDHSWSHVAWYFMPGLGARDAVRKGFDAAEAARSEEENKALQEKFEGAFEAGSHSDRILLITHLGGYKAPEGGGE